MKLDKILKMNFENTTLASFFIKVKDGLSQVVLVVKNLPANAGDAGDTGLIPGLGIFLGIRKDNPLKYSCLENPMNRGAWQATVHGMAKS